TFRRNGSLTFTEPVITWETVPTDTPANSATLLMLGISLFGPRGRRIPPTRISVNLDNRAHGIYSDRNTKRLIRFKRRGNAAGRDVAVSLPSVFSRPFCRSCPYPAIPSWTDSHVWRLLMRKVRTLATVVLSVMALAPGLNSQSVTGQISGTVTDSTG